MKFTDYLAIYAAILSSVVFAWNVLQSKPRIKVDLVFGIEGSDDNLKSGVVIVVRNVSAHEVHLAGIDILYPFRAVTPRERIAYIWRFKRLPRRIEWVHSSLSNYSIESGCPVRLEARKSHQVFIVDPTVEKILAKATQRRLIACVQDQLWHNVYSRAFKYSDPKGG